MTILDQSLFTSCPTHGAQRIKSFLTSCIELECGCAFVYNYKLKLFVDQRSPEAPAKPYAPKTPKAVPAISAVNPAPAQGEQEAKQEAPTKRTRATTKQGAPKQGETPSPAQGEQGRTKKDSRQYARETLAHAREVAIARAKENEAKRKKRTAKKSTPKGKK